MDAMAIAIAREPPASPSFVALLAGTKSNGLPPPLPGCELGGRVGFGFVVDDEDDEEEAWLLFEG